MGELANTHDEWKHDSLEAELADVLFLPETVSAFVTTQCTHTGLVTGTGELVC